jgi:transcriptional regulator with XRE-family HTH domain
MSQAEFARRLHIDPSLVNKWERGTRRVLATELEQICRHLQISPTEFFGSLAPPFVEQLSLLRRDDAAAVLTLVDSLRRCAERRASKTA